jgi:DUF2892 family protein
MFTPNEGTLDRIIRVVAGVGIGVAVFTALTGVWQIVAAVVAAILLLTGIVGFCPLYALLHVNTRGHAVSTAARQ